MYVGINSMSTSMYVWVTGTSTPGTVTEVTSVYLCSFPFVALYMYIHTWRTSYACGCVSAKVDKLVLPLHLHTTACTMHTCILLSYVPMYICMYMCVLFVSIAAVYNFLLLFKRWTLRSPGKYEHDVPVRRKIQYYESFGGQRAFSSTIPTKCHRGEPDKVSTAWQGVQWWCAVYVHAYYVCMCVIRIYLLYIVCATYVRTYACM